MMVRSTSLVHVQNLTNSNNQNHCFRDVEKTFNRRDLSILRWVKKSPLLKIFMTVEGLSAGTTEFTARYFPQLLAIIYIPVFVTWKAPSWFDCYNRCFLLPVYQHHLARSLVLL